MKGTQAQSESDFIPPNWTEADEISYRNWLESTDEGQQELEDAYWSARAAEVEQGEYF